MTDLRGKTIVITGGGAGIGRALCIAAARAGAHVIVSSHHDNGAETAYGTNPVLAVPGGGSASGVIRMANSGG